MAQRSTDGPGARRDSAPGSVVGPLFWSEREAGRRCTGADGDAAYDAFDPSATYNPTADEYLIAWEGDDGTASLVDNEFEIFAQRLSAAGAETGPDDQRISGMGPDGDAAYDASTPSATYNPTANEYLIAWRGDDDTAPLVDNEFEIFARALEAPPPPEPQPDPEPDPDPSPTPDPDPDTEVTDPDVTLDKKIFIKGKEFKGKLGAGAQENVKVVSKATLIEKRKGKKKGKGSTAAKKRKKTKLRTVRKSVEGGERKILRHKFKGPKSKRKRKTRKLKRKIKQGKVKARMRVQVTFTDEAGNTATEKRVARVKVRKRRR